MNTNAAIDKTVIVSPFRLNEIHRPLDVKALPGGKGCNVARALKRLGESPVVSGWVGGFAGQFIENGLHQEGIQTAFVHADFESRTCLSILDPDNHTITEIYENGEPIPPDKIEELVVHFRSIVGSYAAVTLSGSLPPGVPADFYCTLIEAAHQVNIPVLLDSSKDALKHGITAKPYVIKPNRDEFKVLAGRELITIEDYAAAAVEVSREYETIVVITLGADGAIAANGSDVIHVQSPRVDAKSAVGSGDCMLGGLAYGFTHGFTFEETLIHGVAAGTANTLLVGAGNFTLDDFESVRSQVTLTPF